MSNNPVSIGYVGNVTVTVMQGNTVISKRTTHNVGGKRLFKYLSEALAGNTAQVLQMRPQRIALFYDTEADDAKTAAQIQETHPGDPFHGINTSTGVNRVSAYCYFNTAPTTGSDGQAKWRTTLHFAVPYSALIGAPKINLIGLFGTDSTAEEYTTGNDSWDFCAAYYLTKEDGSWDTVDTSTEGTTNLNLIIDWAMNVGNQTGQVDEPVVTNNTTAGALSGQTVAEYTDELGAEDGRVQTDNEENGNNYGQISSAESDSATTLDTSDFVAGQTE